MKMPVLFIGHGSPMNIIEDNSYTHSLNELGKILPRPKAIVVVSAHWQTRGTYITAAELPPTIYDFYGFPEELYAAAYSCPGSPATAALVQTITKETVKCDWNRGLDHAAWAVLKHMYPHADIPVLELSLDRGKSPQQHYELGNQLAPLRQEGILIIGSGNIVHNLSRIDFSQLYGTVYPWAAETDGQMAAALVKRDHAGLVNYETFPNARLAVPTNEHYLPMLYAIALQTETDRLEFTCTDIQNGSISMRSFMISEN
ncbi:4,5-DOPA dioxygenase extradiol [Sporomusa termitida]|uniref:4,5-DOPA dioxygenase extradiol n=1 Tax=Sporomusa termitida TaxID=2377 RepID=A0A517DW98_9FIRM|nr:4,5-DOPA dioxygenase extradiol [Sporomusa termitida]QDR81632.1 4,5-DOPA dioxygenase extradiol [Sporomusa termitida]